MPRYLECLCIGHKEQTGKTEESPRTDPRDLRQGFPSFPSFGLWFLKVEPWTLAVSNLTD